MIICLFLEMYTTRYSCKKRVNPCAYSSVKKVSCICVNILQMSEHLWNVYGLRKHLCPGQVHAQTLNVYVIPLTFKVRAFGKALPRARMLQLHRNSMNVYAFVIFLCKCGTPSRLKVNS